MTMDVVMLVARCNRRADRARGLPVLCDRIEEMKVLINLGKEVKAFASLGELAEVMDQVVALARRAEAVVASHRRESWARAGVTSRFAEGAVTRVGPKSSRPASRWRLGAGIKTHAPARRKGTP